MDIPVASSTCPRDFPVRAPGALLQKGGEYCIHKPTWSDTYIRRFRKSVGEPNTSLRKLRWTYRRQPEKMQEKRSQMRKGEKNKRKQR